LYLPRSWETRLSSIERCFNKESLCFQDLFVISRIDSKLFHKEFFILSRLAQARGQVVSLQTLWEYAWGNNAPFNAGTIRAHVYQLRLKLAPYGIEIDGVVNVGYRLHSDAPTEGRITRRRR
jgi:DNA-binding response OmpR family regulator